MANDLQKTEGKGTALGSLRSMLEEAVPKLEEVAQQHISASRLVRLLLSACSRNPWILECTKTSVLNFCMKCAETGLEPIGAGGCWPIPYKNTKTKPPCMELTFQADYRGLANCAIRAGCIKAAPAYVVRANDKFSYTLGLNQQMTHEPARGDRGDLEFAYCIVVFPDNREGFVVMDREEVFSCRSRSQAYRSKSGPWITDEAEMWKKTVIKRAMKPFAGMSASLDAAMAYDDEIEIEAPVPVPMPKAIGETNGATERDPGVEDEEHDWDGLLDNVRQRLSEAKGPMDFGQITADVFKVTWLTEEQRGELIAEIEAAKAPARKGK